MWNQQEKSSLPKWPALRSIGSSKALHAQALVGLEEQLCSWLFAHWCDGFGAMRSDFPCVCTEEEGPQLNRWRDCWKQWTTTCLSDHRHMIYCCDRKTLSNLTQEYGGDMHIGMKVIRRRIYLDQYRQHSISIQGEIDKCWKFKLVRSVFALREMMFHTHSNSN